MRFSDKLFSKVNFGPICIFDHISLVSSIIYIRPYLLNTFQIKSAVATIEDTGDGPLNEELDEITKVCVIVLADIITILVHCSFYF